MHRFICLLYFKHRFPDFRGPNDSYFFKKGAVCPWQVHGQIVFPKASVCIYAKPIVLIGSFPKIDSKSPPKERDPINHETERDGYQYVGDRVVKNNILLWSASWMCVSNTFCFFSKIVHSPKRKIHTVPLNLQDIPKKFRNIRTLQKQPQKTG